MSALSIFFVFVFKISEKSNQKKQTKWTFTLNKLMIQMVAVLTKAGFCAKVKNTLTFFYSACCTFAAYFNATFTDVKDLST